MLDLLHLSRSSKKKKALNTNRLKALCVFQTWHMYQRWCLGLFKGHGRKRTCCSVRI